MSNAKERLELINQLAVAMRNDHNYRHGKGLEDGKFNQGNFDAELEAAFPQVGTSELLNTSKKLAKRLNDNPDITIRTSFDKIDAMLKFIFGKWKGDRYPTVVSLVKSYANGEYAHYADGAKTEDEKDIDYMLHRLGDTSDAPTHIKLLRLYVEQAIQFNEQHKEDMSKTTKEMKKMVAKEAMLTKALKDVINRLSQKKDLLPEEREQLEKAKKLVD